ncbi:MAG: adenylate kinase [Bacteroidetes bacterium]|nr:adenylate kinase [Bacteroidota bacterium]
MLNLILFGPPGSGKGTQAARVAEKYNLLHLSTGDMLREELRRESALGKEAKRFIDEGLLVPDEVIIGMISDKIDATSNVVKGYLFDGFPRTQPQAEALDNLLSLKNTQIAGVLALDVSEEEITRRILSRGESSGRSDDRDESIIRNRYQVYQNETAPVANHYKASNRFVLLPGEGSVEAIFNSLSEQIDRLL